MMTAMSYHDGDDDAAATGDDDDDDDNDGDDDDDNDDDWQTPFDFPVRSDIRGCIRSCPFDIQD